MPKAFKYIDDHGVSNITILDSNIKCCSNRNKNAAPMETEMIHSGTADPR